MSLIQQAIKEVKLEQATKKDREDKEREDAEYRPKIAAQELEKFVNRLGQIDGYEIIVQMNVCTISAKDVVVAEIKYEYVERHDSDGYGIGEFYIEETYKLYQDGKDTTTTRNLQDFLKKLVVILGLVND